MDEPSLHGRVIAITGGTRGIGASVAREVARAGADVILFGRRPGPAVKTVVRDVRASGRESTVRYMDVRDPRAVERALAKAHAWKGRLDGLVTSAGVFRGDSIGKTGLSAWNEVVETDLQGTFFTVRAAAPYLQRAPSASVVTVSSILARSADAGGAAYQAAKAGIEQMTRALALELAPRIRVNCVAPGFIRTDMNRAGHTDPAFARFIAGRTPLGRWGEPDDIAPAVRFLLGDDARFITGAILAIDGGLAVAGAFVGGPE